MEGQIASPISTLGLLINQLSIGMPIRVSGISEKWKSQYTVYQTKGNKQVLNKGFSQGGQSQRNGQRYA